MTNFTKFDDLQGDMYFISGSGLRVPVSGTKISGYVPTVQPDGNVQWMFVSGSGGSGGGSGDTFSYWDSLKPFSQPSAYDIDFSTATAFPTTAPASYSNAYVGDFLTASYNDKVPGALLTQGNDGNWHGKGVVIPAGDFNIAMQVKVMGDATDFTIAQLGLTNTINETTGNVSIQVGYRSAFGGWSVHTESETGSANIHNWGVQQVAENDIILRWRRVGTTYYSAWSTDGRQWSEQPSGSTLPFTPNWFIFLTYGNSSQGTGVNGVAYKWIRYLPTGSAQNFGGWRSIGNGLFTASLALTASSVQPRDLTPLPVSDSIYMRFDSRYSPISHSNGMVWQWNDLSGNNYHASATASISRPKYLQKGFNNWYPCLYFNGRTNVLRTPPLATLPQPFTVVSVLHNYTGSSGNDVNIYRSQDLGVVSYINSATGLFALFGGLVFSGSTNTLHTQNVTDVPVGMTSNPAVRIDTWQTGSTSISLNGTDVTGGSAGTNPLSGSFMSIGATVSGTPPSAVSSTARMYLAALIIYSRALTSAERQQLYDYFNSAYGVVQT